MVPLVLTHSHICFPEVRQEKQGNRQPQKVIGRLPVRALEREVRLWAAWVGASPRVTGTKHGGRLRHLLGPKCTSLCMVDMVFAFGGFPIENDEC